MSWFEHNTSRINYEDCGDGTPILLLPGLTGSIEELTPLREALTAAGYRVIAADLPGSGRSGPQPRAYTATYFADDARSFAALLAHLTTGPAHLVGFSDGGEVSLLIAATMPGLARSVTTWGAAGQLNDPEGRLRHATYNLIDDPIPPLQGFRAYLIATYGEANARAMTQSVVGAFNDIIATGGDVSLSHAHKIACPTLLITGEHDPFAPPPLLAQLATRIPAAETREVPAAGHDLHHTHAPWLTETILSFLGKQDGK